MAIRWRLTLWFSLIFLVILVISGIVLNALLQRYLLRDIDSNLQTYSAQVHGTLHASSTGPLDFNVIHASLPPINQFTSPGIYIQIIDSTGLPMVKSDNLADQQLPFSQTLIQKVVTGEPEISTLAAEDGARVRIMASPLYTLNQTLVLEVAESLTPFDSALSQFKLAFIGGALLALLLTIILGALLIRRTLRPVEAITRTALNIEASSDLEKRVGYRGPADEIGRLADTFDLMIERLDKTFASQRHFVADASHELRSPLTVIQGNLDLLKRDISPADRQESLQAIQSETRRLTQIASDLLLLAEIESGQSLKLESVSLNSLLNAEVQRACSLADGRSFLFARLEDIAVTTDVHKLTQAISNLLDNAIKYTPPPGVITLSLFRNGDWTRLEVCDSGIGIAAADLPHIFDRFYRADKARSRAAGGTGLGLAIVKGVMDQLGGKVTVVSQPGQGSTFTLWLKI